MSVAKQVTKLARQIKPNRPGGVNMKWKTGLPNQLDTIQEDSGRIERYMAAIMYEQKQQYRRGMLYDDFAHQQDVRFEAVLSRTSYETIQEMQLRAIRHDFLVAKKRWLPENEWTPMDSDHRFLKDTMDRYDAEVKEQKLIKCAMHDWNDFIDWAVHLPYRLINYQAIKEAQALLIANDQRIFA